MDQQPPDHQTWSRTAQHPPKYSVHQEEITILAAIELPSPDGDLVSMSSGVEEFTTMRLVPLMRVYATAPQFFYNIYCSYQSIFLMLMKEDIFKTLYTMGDYQAAWCQARTYGPNWMLFWRVACCYEVCLLLEQGLQTRERLSTYTI